MAAMPDGGVLILLNRLPPWVGNMKPFDLVRLAVDGTTLWSRTIEVPDSSSSGLGFAWRLATNASGEIFVSGGATWASVVIKLTDLGVPVWCRRIWDTDFQVGLDVVTGIRAMDDGGCVFLGIAGSTLTAATVSAGRLDAGGNVLWIHSYAYNATNMYLSEAKISNGPGNLSIVAAQATLSGVSSNILAYWLDPFGNLIRSDLYNASGQYFANAAVCSVNDNDHYLVGSVGAAQRAAVARLDSMGAVLGCEVVTLDTVGTWRRSIYGWSGDVRGGAIQLASDLVQEDLTFGVVTRTSALWRGSSGFASACFTEPLALQRSTVPAGVVTITAVGLSQPLVTASQAVAVVNDLLPTPSAASFCTAVPVSEHRAEPEWTLSPNPVTNELFVSGQGLTPGTRWTIMEASGSIVKSGRLSGSNERIAVQALVSGAYVLRMVNDHGTQAERFIKY